eukprot:CAMPEP_0201578218 /NCGR_PEP_ID=MMETSP0190_2-20130828/24999_1 /ASSEMBLY_ACC=CAM_ASM_000263 /TAXON_ID=37353 /ORGANISM="Rosalina sp." /LENGTH=1479 /DNA_ID=CAMNT_0048011165 /DNA_START=92 /DNA_END=4531 /DNA_ORIENTATION=+
MSKQEKRRLERLKKELDNQQKKLDEDKKKFATQKKELRESKQKLERQKKQLDQKVRKFQLSQSNSSSTGGGRKTKSGGGKSNAELNKTKGELKDCKDQLNKTKKNVRELRKAVDEKDALIKSLQRQVKNAGKGKKPVGDDKIIKQLKREIANLKKRLKLALRDLDKQARYYQQQLKRFKQDQQKWINRQRDVHKKKGVVVKYVFIDDIRKIKVYKKGKNRIKIRTRDGGEVIVKDVQIVEASEVEEAADDIIDEVTQEIEAEFKKKKKKKRRKKIGADSDDEDAYEEVEDDEDDEPQNLDDVKDDNDPYDDHTDEIYAELMQELSLRTKDLHRINEIYCNDEDDETQDGQFKELWESVIGRHDAWTTKLTEELKYDLADELPELNKNWQDEIYKIKNSVVIIRRRARKKGKAEGIEEAKASGQYASGSANDGDESKQNAANEMQYLIAAKDQMITELNGRISDLTQLNSIYFHPEDAASILSKEQQVQELINNVESRHESILNELSELPPSENAIDELLPENNDQWKSLIYETGKEMGQNDAEPLRQELELRTQDLDKAVKVVNGEAPASDLNDLVAGIQQRTDAMKKKAGDYDDQQTKEQKATLKDQDEWLLIMNKLKSANSDLQNQLADAKAEADAAKAAADKNKDKGNQTDMGPVAKAQKIVIEGLLKEMDNRRKDLNQLSDLNSGNDENAVNQAQQLRVAAVKRHQQANNDLAQNVRALAVAAKQAGGDGDKDIQDALKLIEQDNKKWQDQLNKLVDDTKNVDDLKKRNRAQMDELSGRIADVLKMKDLYDKANDKDDKNSRANADKQFDSLQSAVKDRHEGVEGDMQKAIDTKKTEDRAVFKEFQENGEDWRDAIFNTASHVTGLNEPEPAPAKPERVYAEAKEKEPVKQKTKVKREAVYDDEQKEWWLDKDPKRRAFIDTIKADSEQQKQILEVSAYCDRVLYHPNTDDMGVATDLYFPIPAQDQHHILSVFYDGTMLCDLINRIDPDYVDKRVINYPDPFEPYPLTDKAVIENASLMLSAAKAIGVEMTSYDVEDWMDPSKHTGMLIELTDGLADKLLTKRFNPQERPELCRLIKSGEDPLDVEQITGQQWLSRWMNQQSGKGLTDEVELTQWNSYTYSTMKSVSPIFNNAAPVDSYKDDPSKASMSMITHVTNKLDRGTTVRPSDLTNTSFTKVHRYFTAEAYYTKSGLAALNSSEEAKYKKYLKKAKKSDEDTFINWINAMLPAHLHVNTLTRDLSDGVVLLKLLEKAKPGCVNWKKAREKVRHKFDKLNNCNMVMSLSQQDPFNFSLVGMGGNDIVDGNQKFLSTLLWQLMRYNAVKQISELSFGGKPVTDGDILQWANLTIQRFEDRQSKPISNFKDRKLTTCIFYIELLAACRPQDVDASLINYDVKPLVNNRVDDKSRKERIDNARLAMSYCRKFGQELFVLPEHLTGMDAKAVLSMFAAIMTVGMTDNAYTGGGDKRVNDAMMGY